MTTDASSGNTTGGAAAVAEGNVVLAALVGWVERQQRPEDTAATDAWLEQLQPKSPFWRISGKQLPRDLADRLEAVVRLFHWITSDPPPSPPERLQQWLTYSGEVAARWSSRNAADWEALLVGLSRQGNRLVDGLIAQALSAALQAGRIPTANTAALAPLLRPLLPWIQELPLPPARGRSLLVADYALLYRHAAICQELESVTAAMADRLGETQEALAKLLSQSGARRLLEDLEQVARSLREARGELLSLVASGRAGWPVEIAAVRQAAAEVGAAVEQLRPLSDPLLASLKTASLGLAERLRGSLTSLGLEAAAGPAPSAALAPAPEPLPPLASLNTCLSPPPAATWHDRILSLAGAQPADEVELAQALARRLEDLARLWRNIDARTRPTDRSEPLRELMGCLIFLDAELRQPRRPAWLETARDELRRILREEGSYRLLDAELIGASLSGHESETEPVGLIEAKAVRAGHIARIQQPGYAMLKPDGEAVVLRKARVWLAK